MHGKIRNFVDLIAWQESHKFVLEIYHLTSEFPKQEQFELTRQMRRAAISLTSNIAEGFSRFSNKEKSQFYSIALGSLSEIYSQLILAKDIAYVTPEILLKCEINILFIRKLITGLIRATHTLYSPVKYSLVHTPSSILPRKILPR